MQLDDALGHGEAEPRAAGARGVEGLEDPLDLGYIGLAEFLPAFVLPAAAVAATAGAVYWIGRLQGFKGT